MNEPQTPEQAPAGILDQLEKIGLGPDQIIGIIQEYQELRLAVVDIPPQIETLARATLACKFITETKDGITFKRSQFEQVWAAVAGLDPDEQFQPTNHEQ